MNKGLFRLVFSKRLGMYVPAPEVAVVHSGGGASSARARRRALLALIASIAAGHASADIIPLPQSGLQVSNIVWSNAAITAASPTVTTIQQYAPQAIANWQKFNLARDHTLNIEGQLSNWGMLHRIYDNDPSIIAGTINAAGTNYFLNNNGIVFAEGAQINMGSVWAMTASNMTDELFRQGFINNLAGEATFTGMSGFVKVEAGAHLNAATGGKVVLLAKDVENNGLITTPEGQTILAAGEKVYLKSTTDLAGMLVEVDSGGTATNLGEIIAERGNASLVGLAVNQMGRIKASTSVRANGSIHLLARDSVRASDGVAQRFGKVTLGEGSVTEVTVEDKNPEEIGNTVVLKPSTVTAEGRLVDVKGTINAKGGVVNLNAKRGTENATATMPVRVFLDDTARIDVSGVDAKAAMSKNQLEIRLYSEELKDTPMLKGGTLLGEYIYVDARKGTDLFDIQPYLDTRTQTIAERMSAGGTVNISSAGDVITKQGSVIDVSGGVIDYAAGVVKESTLVYQGRIVPISQARRDTPYQRIGNQVTVTDRKSGMSRTFILDQGTNGNFQQAYRQGGDAGTINVTSTGGSPVIDGTMVANTRHDITQRAQLPDGGKFNLMTGDQTLTVVDDAGNVSATFSADTANTQQAQIDTSMLANGFNHVKFESQGKLNVDAAITTAANGSVGLKGRNVDINRSIMTPGGSITVETQTSTDQVNVRDDVVLSTAGTWANDITGIQGAFTMPVALNGGHVSLTGGTVAFGERTLIDTSAGAWLDGQGTWHQGNGGNITLAGGSELNRPANMRAYGFTRGGELSLSTGRDIHVGGQNPGDGSFWLSESFFEQGGFSSYTIKTTGNNSEFVVGDATGRASVIHPKMQTLQQVSGFAGRASANSIQEAGVATPVMMAEGLRAPATVKFSAYGDDNAVGSLTVLENTTIRTDVPDINGNVGSITLDAGKQLTMLGSLITPAGKVKLDLLGAVDASPYDNSQSIWLGENSVINVAGYYLRPPSYTYTGSLLQARVFDGGSVHINTGEGQSQSAGKGFVIAQEGSVIDVSGTSGQVDVTTGDRWGYHTSTLYGAAGDIEIRAREGMALDGSLIGSAQGTGERGTLSVGLIGDLTPSSQSPAPPTGERVLTVTTGKQVQASGLSAGDSLASFEGKAQISTEQINAGQFDHVSLRSTTDGRAPSANQHDRIDLESGVNLVARQTLALTAPRINVLDDGQVSLNASHVTFSAPLISNDMVAGQGLLQVNADWIDLNGSPNISGVNRTELNSRLDIRMRGLTADNHGSFRTPGELQMTARQIYPVTNSAFTVEATGPGSHIKVKSSGVAPKAVFSAGGKLTLKAENIQQDGVIRAPLGEIELQAEDTLTIGENSLTSTSAEGLSIPYGYTADGGNSWRFPNNVNLGKTPMEKSIVMTGRTVDQKQGAVVDLSGNGDTFAYEFIPGLGGSTDILKNKAGVFAILPSLQGEYAPFDYDYYQYANTDAGYAPKVGQSIYIAGGKGLAAGFYTLLPARYALLEGAFMVEVDHSIQPGPMINNLLDGTTLSAGYFTDVNGFSRDAYWTTFKVTDGAVFRNPEASGIKVPAEYMITSGNDYFTRQAISNGTAIPRLATDAGQLVLNASERLNLQATLKTDASKGRGAMVDIVSENIKVVSTVGDDDGSLQLTAESLNALNAESILLGGRRSQGAEATEIDTVAKNVTFSNSSSGLSVDELIATAAEKVAVDAGASISTNATEAAGENMLRVKGDGALLAVSGKHDLVYDRVNTTSNPSIGVLDIADGSVVSAHNSLVLDATREADIAGSVTIVPQDDGSLNGSVTLGANNILIGDADPSVSGMRVDDQLLSSFGSLSKVTLNSQQDVNLYGDVSLGNEALDVTINAGGIVGHEVNGSADATLTAASLTLKNSAGAVSAPVIQTSGSQLTVNADSIYIEGKGEGGPTGAGNFALAGYDQIALNSTSDIVFSGAGTLNSTAQHTTLTSQRVTAATGTDYAVLANHGRLTTQGNGTTAEQASSGLGAKLSLTAASMALGGSMELLSGQLNARATTGDLNIASDANINAGSAAVAFDKYTAHTPGGMVSLQADQADIHVMDGATINVGGGEGGNAGTVRMTAVNGSVNVAEGTLQGAAAEGKTAGNFVLDSRQLADFSVLNSALNAGGFNASRNLRIRSGDVTIAQADSVNAQKLVLSADDGSVNILGTVNASGKDGGNVQIYAKNDLTLNAGSQVLAKGDAENGKGGKVLLASDSGIISAANGALVDVGGSERGQVNMRAARDGVAGLKVDHNATSAVAGADKILLESVQIISPASGTLNAATLNSIRSDTNQFYASAASSSAAYQNSSDGVAAIVAPHTELRVDGNTSLSNDWNLRDLSQGGDGALTIRSTGNLQLNGSISDGFSTALANTGALQAGDSWSINLVSGADLNAVNTLETIAGTGNMTLANNKLVRTGTGDINIATGGNFTLNNAGSVVYTAGRAADALAGFNGPNAGAGNAATQYLTGGGDISIAAQGDITGALLNASGVQQIPNNWIFRQGGGVNNLPTSWWLRTDLFQQGVAAFGGGNVDVSAGGHVTNFSVSVPTTGRYVSEDSYRVDGGGDIRVAAGGDINNGVYYAGRGHIDLNAGGSVNKAGNTIGTTLALQDATASVSAVRDVYLEAVFNPTLFAQTASNTTIPALGAANSPANTHNGSSAYFNTYSAQAGIDVMALIGNVQFGNTDTASNTITDKLSKGAGNLLMNQSITASKSSLGYLPGSVQATAFEGDINATTLKLMPSSQGNLSLLAGGNVSANTIMMSDADMTQLPGVFNPMRNPNVESNVIGRLNNFIMTNHAANPVHANNRKEAAIVARNGSISFRNNDGSDGTINVNLPKAASIIAGQDIVNLNIHKMSIDAVSGIQGQIQHTDPSDLTVIKAGRDVKYTTGNTSGMQLAGPGNFVIQAGRHLDLGAGSGINSVANTVNSFLPETGASLTVLAGVGQGPHVSTYINTYIDPQGSGPAVLAGDATGMAAYRASTAKAVTEYMRELSGDVNLSEEDAMTQYLALDQDRQAVFAFRHYSSELLASGEADAALMASGEDISGIQRHKRGDDAVATLFPRQSDNDYFGDLTLFDSRIRTARDGSIDILVPGGMVNAGVPGRAVTAGNGIVTESGGAIRAFAETDFQVNQSRVMTQFGSDITVWVNNGNIDAGKGSRSVVAVPEAEIFTDKYGNTTLRIKGAGSGSGIQAGTYDPDGPSGPLSAPELGTVALMAPRGVLDAGEAGILGGRVLAVAPQIVNAGNIVGTTTVGVPIATTGTLAGTVSGASNVASATTASLDGLMNLPQDFNVRDFMPSFVTVEILGLGNIFR